MKNLQSLKDAAKIGMFCFVGKCLLQINVIYIIKVCI